MPAPTPGPLHARVGRPARRPAFPAPPARSVPPAPPARPASRPPSSRYSQSDPDCLGHIRPSRGRMASQIGKGPGHAQDPVCATSGDHSAPKRFLQRSQRAGRRAEVTAKNGTRYLAVDPPRCSREPPPLPITCFRHPIRDDLARFAGRHRRHPGSPPSVARPCSAGRSGPHRTGDPKSVPAHSVRAALARAASGAVVPALARVGRQHEKKAGREHLGRLSTRDDDLAMFERLAECVEHLRGEFWRFVQGTARPDAPGLPLPAAGSGCRRRPPTPPSPCGVGRRTEDA